ncbi:biotin-dependent carboxyltransferase family protein [Bordetella sp. 02P26C-1]|uniref:5-oxoprolinase subunit C family protein n=1 Tax=Bordetella sp. 02P26C-1 TaxID=2683195 RepID=UPI0013552E8F|nr:biotin-dependent carboxyltransferase family protein [Bordetella sp. 02P26C-1]MVW79211.1 5-oxoprolinase/urea amidolyase family protein [Bordetella sp. 02P26C-1]
MSIRVLKPGLLSTFQDAGRTGSQHLGVQVSGAMDPRAHRLANLLVGNEADLATLEITMLGPTLQFEAPACFAIAGADMQAMLNDSPVPNHRPLVARAGDVLTLGPATPGSGVRAYLAVHGGYELAPVLASTSTDIRGAFGGHAGRALTKNDLIGLRYALPDSEDDLSDLAQTLWQVRIYLPAALALRPRSRLRVLPGVHWDEFTAESQRELLEAEYRISTQSDRMGYRLEGPKLSMTTPRQILSEAASFGTIQVPSGGEAIVLMADRQSTGGYPKIAQVISVDLPDLAQRRPGQPVCFAPVELDEAQQLDSELEDAFEQVHEVLAAARTVLESIAKPK